MRNAWRECSDELAEAENAWFEGDNHQKYLEWVHKWTTFVRMGLNRTADEVDASIKKYEDKTKENNADEIKFSFSTNR